MKQQLKFALIGCGRIGAKHASLMQSTGKLIAICDTDEIKAAGFAAQTGASAYTDHLQMLAENPEIDLVSVCTPNGLHARHSMDVLDHHRHVLCEKPMAIRTSECEQMISLAQQVQKQLFVVKQNRYNPPVVALKKLIDEGRLGKLYSFQLNCFWNRDAGYYRNSWKGTADLDGGTLFTQFSHFIDLVCWLFGPVKEAQAMTGNFGHEGIIDFEDTGVVIVKFAGGVIGTINYTVNAFKKNMEGSLAVFGEKGTVKVGGQYLNELEYQQIENYLIPDLPKGAHANNYGEYQGSMSNHHKVYENVVDVLLHGGPMTTTPEEAMESVRAISLIYEAAKINS